MNEREEGREGGRGSREWDGEKERLKKMSRKREGEKRAWREVCKDTENKGEENKKLERKKESENVQEKAGRIK